MHSHEHWAGLFLCLLLVVSPLFIPQAVRAAPSGVMVNRYFCQWMDEVSTSNTTWTDPEPSTGYYPLQLTFTPPSTANYLVLHAATLSNSSTSYSTSYRLLMNETELCSRDFTPREIGDYVPFACHGVTELTGSTEYTFKIQFKTSNASGTAYLRDSHILVVLVSDYHYAAVEAESSTTLTEYGEANTKTTLTFTPSSAGDYLVLSSCEMKIDGASRAFYTRLIHGSTSQGEVIREPTVANENRAYTIIRVISFDSGEQTLKIQYKTEISSATAYIKVAHITAVRLSDLGIDVNSTEAETPSTTTSETYVDKATLAFTPSPNQQGDYLIVGFCLLKGDKTNRKAYAQLDQDGTPHSERSFRPDDTKDYIPFIIIDKHRTSPGSHTFKIQFKTEASNMTVECQNARLLAIKVNTIQSYSDAGVTECSNYTRANHIARVYGYCYRYDYEAEPPAGMSYHIAYYDNDGTQVASVADTSIYNRSINSAYDLSTDKNAKAGTWHAVVYQDSVGDPANTYTANDSNSVLELESQLSRLPSIIPPPAPPINYQPDNQIRNHGETDYIGDDIYNTDGADQTKSQAVTVNVTAIYEIKLQNDATGMDALNVTGTAGGSGWTVTYYSVDEDADVTHLVTEGIWYTRTMLSGDWEEMRLEVTPDSTMPAGSSIEVLITLASAYGDTHDVVKATTWVTFIPGDANGDGNINALDITKVEMIVAGLDAETPGADANQDGSINALDITKVERIIAGLD